MSTSVEKTSKKSEWTHSINDLLRGSDHWKRMLDNYTETGGVQDLRHEHIAPGPQE